MVGIIDYGCGNVQSILNIHAKIGIWAEIISTPEDLSKAAIWILPGVGSFDKAVVLLKEKGFWNHLKNVPNNPSVQLIGICLGMQLLFDSSEEGEQLGLGILPGLVARFSSPEIKKVPLIAWKKIESQSHCFLSDIDKPFYFVHGYHAPLDLEESKVLAYAEYGYRYPAVVQKENALGIQFHPEKSLTGGMDLLTNLYKTIMP